jgi:hypothetical protein
MDNHFGGTCGALFGQVPAMTLSPAAAVTTGVWRDDMRPASVWAGDMMDQRIVRAAAAILSTEAAWNRTDNRE